MENAADKVDEPIIPAPFGAEIPAAATDAQDRAVIVARILEGRSQRPLPPGMTIEEVIAWGRPERA